MSLIFKRTGCLLLCNSLLREFFYCEKLKQIKTIFEEDGSMVGKKRFLVIGIILMMVVMVWGCTPAGEKKDEQESGQEIKEEEIIQVGISQLAEHPALDASREGFIEGLATEGFIDGENITIDFQNAQGDFPTAQLIAQNFLSQEMDMIFAIATPAAQAAFNTTKDIPILVTAVTDPVEAGLAESWEVSNTNVTGTSDMTPMKEQFSLLQELVPEAQKIGVLYNTSEENSEIQIRKMKEIAEKLNLEVVPSGITNTNEIPQALDALIGNIDVLYIPTDNLVAASMPLIVDKTNEKGIPVIGSERAHVEAGALATEGISYYELGFQTALMAVDIINGKQPSELPISTMKEYELVINEDSAKLLKIEISDHLKEKAKMIKGGVGS